MVKFLKDISASPSLLEQSEHSLEQNERTIHLSDLDLNASEYKINDLFRSINLKPSKIVKQPFSSFAYVTFDSLQVVKFLLSKSQLIMNDRLVHILPFSQSNNFDPNANLIIKNLETYLSEVHIIEKFKPYGEILSCKLVRDSQGESKCYAYLQYKHKSSASEAIDNLNNTYWDIKYDPDFHYQKYKERLFYLKQGQTMGRNILNYQDENHLFSSDMDKKSMHGKKLYVGIFKKKDEYFRIKKEKEGKPSNLYVKNFGPNFGDRDLFNLFKVYGSIKSAKVRRQKFGLVEKPLGCGFVDFEEPEEAEKARLGLDGHVLKNSGRVISVTYADCKSRRMRKRLEESIDDSTSNNSQGNESIIFPESSDLTASMNSDCSMGFSDIESKASDYAEHSLNTSFYMNPLDDDSISNHSGRSSSEADSDEETRNRSISTSSDSSFDLILMDWTERWNRQIYSEYKLF